VVDSDPLSLCFVHQVETDYYPAGDFKDLKDKVEVPFQTGGIHDNDGTVRLTEEDKIPSDLFINGGREEGISSGEVYELVTFFFISDDPFSTGYCLSRPVARVLAESGQGIEDSRLSRVGVSRQGNNKVPVVRFDSEGCRVCRAFLTTASLSKGNWDFFKWIHWKSTAYFNHQDTKFYSEFEYKKSL
jgi:hypothetical protein